MEVSIGSKQQAVVDPNIDDPQSQNLPSVRAAMALGAVSGDVSSSDLKIPYLSIAYGVGKLAKTFNPGDLILGGEHLLAKRKEPLTIVILSAVRYFKERLSQEDFASGLRPRTFMTEQEVRAANGTLEWRDGSDGKRIAPTFGPAMDTKILIQKPEALDQGVFGLELDGKLYTPAYFSVDKAGFTRVGKEIITQQSLALSAGGLLHGVWQLFTDVELVNGNNTVVPKIRLTGRTTETFRKEVTALFNG